jgi:hypothetical protein
MKTRYLLCIPITVFFLAGFIPTGFAQSSQCTVVEKQDSLVTLSCAGEGTKVINMGGSADIYKPGDSITITGTGQSDKSRQVSPGKR